MKESERVKSKEVWQKKANIWGGTKMKKRNLKKTK